MSKDLDTNLFPLAYLMTFRTYGTWMHGEQRGSIDRQHNVYGTPGLETNDDRKKAEIRQLNHPPILLKPAQRKAVEAAIREACDVRHYNLLALNVRTNHVHAVIAAARTPEPILVALKAYATRKLRSESLVSATTKPWARHGSTRYLWKEEQVANAIAYVMYDQGE